MACRSVSSFVSRDVDVWLYSAPLEAAITHTTARLNEGEPHPYAVDSTELSSSRH